MGAPVPAATILECSVMHQRLVPVSHGFEYPVFMFRLDIQRFSEISSHFFSVNRWNLSSFFPSDYLYRRTTPLFDEICTLIASHGGDRQQISRIELVTAARYFGYVFNPVSFYYCFDRDGVVRYHVAEINNTYGERHPYILGLAQSPRSADAPSGKIRYRVPKEFFVSPFNHVEGEYEFTFDADPSVFDVRIDVLKSGEPPFVSRIWGKRAPAPLTTSAHLSVLFRFPIAALLTVPRILWHAQILHLLKRLPMLDPPAPVSSRTFSTWWRKDKT